MAFQFRALVAGSHGVISIEETINLRDEVDECLFQQELQHRFNITEDNDRVVYSQDVRAATLEVSRRLRDIESARAALELKGCSDAKVYGELQYSAEGYHMLMAGLTRCLILGVTFVARLEGKSLSPPKVGECYDPIKLNGIECPYCDVVMKKECTSPEEWVCPKCGARLRAGSK